MPDMKVGHVELFVRDPHKSLAFYEEVLGFERVALQPQTAWVKAGQTEILLRPGQNPNPTARYGDGPSALTLYTDDLAGTRAELERRGLTFQGTDGSEECLTFTDPDGHWFQLVDPGDHT